MTPVPSFAAAAVAEGSGVAGAGTAGGRARQAGQLQPFLNRGRQQGAGQAGPVLQARQDRSSSAGKRQRVDQEGGWQEQRPYRAGRQQRGHQQGQHRVQAPVIKGTSGEFSELAGPVTFWVGKCRPELTEQRIKEIITKCAESCGVENFLVEDVKCLTRDPNPWTRSFKVSVPARLEAAMHNPQMYPGTWEARPFTKWPSRQQQDPACPQQGGHSASQPVQAVQAEVQEASVLMEAAALPAEAEANIQ